MPPCIVNILNLWRAMAGTALSRPQVRQFHRGAPQQLLSLITVIVAAANSARSEHLRAGGGLRSCAAPRACAIHV